MAISTKAKTRLRLLGAGLLFGLGLDTATFSSWPLMTIAVVLVVTGVSWFVHTLLTSNPDGVLFSKRREIVLALGTASITIVVIVVAATAVRIGPRHFALENQSYDADLGWAPPDVPDRVGQRGQTIDPDRPHVVFAGDSIIYGHGVGDNETAPHLLEGMLGGEQVLNIAVSGYSLDQDYIYVKRVLPLVNAKLVVVGVFTGNDYEVTGLEYGWGHTKPLFKMRDGAMVLHNEDLLADNCIDHLAQSLFFRLLWSKKERALDLIHLFCEPAKLGPLELEQVIGGIFSGIENAAHDAGAKVLFVMLPQTQHLQEVERNWRYFRRYSLLRKLLRDGGHETYEFYPDLARVGGEEQTEMFLDGAHLTPRGHRLLAETLLRVIRERKLL